MGPTFLAPTGALEEGILSVRPSVRACVILFKITVKMSSSSILKSPGGKGGSSSEGAQARKLKRGSSSEGAQARELKRGSSSEGAQAREFKQGSEGELKPGSSSNGAQAGESNQARW